MRVTCKRCKREFKLLKNVVIKYTQDGLCGKCRSRKESLRNQDKYRKNNTCPTCGKKILNISKHCSRCSQLGKNNHNYIHGNASSLRVCSICGNFISTGSSGQCAACYQQTLVGAGNPNYKNGHYTGNFCSSAEYKRWKIAVFERDDWTCALCNKRERTHANAHHILPKRDYPELVYDIDNGITLCPKCHELTFGSEYNYVKQLQRKLRPNKNSVNSVNAEMSIPSQV